MLRTWLATVLGERTESTCPPVHPARKSQPGTRRLQPIERMSRSRTDARYAIRALPSTGCSAGGGLAGGGRQLGRTHRVHGPRKEIGVEGQVLPSTSAAEESSGHLLHGDAGLSSGWHRTLVQAFAKCKMGVWVGRSGSKRCDQERPGIRRQRRLARGTSRRPPVPPPASPGCDPPPHRHRRVEPQRRRTYRGSLGSATGQSCCSDFRAGGGAYC